MIDPRLRRKQIITFIIFAVLLLRHVHGVSLLVNINSSV